MGKYSLLGLGALALVACGADAVDARPDGGSAPALAPITLSGNWHASCAIAEGGARAFYSGRIAQQIVDAVQHAPRNPGGMTLADLSGYRAKERAPVCGDYRQWRLCSMGPPSSGGIAIVQILGMLQHFPAAQLQPGTLSEAHLFTQASRLAYADRARYLADSDFIDVPVKNYSTGMYARLGFSVAVHLMPDVLLVDEVLAVGDTQFQQKCLDRIGELRRRGTTIVLVSHQMPMIERMCDRVCLLVKGRLDAEGGAREVLARYQEVASAGPAHV